MPKRRCHARTGVYPGVAYLNGRSDPRRAACGERVNHDRRSRSRLLDYRSDYLGSLDPCESKHSRRYSRNRSQTPTLFGRQHPVKVAGHQELADDSRADRVRRRIPVAKSRDQHLILRAYPQFRHHLTELGGQKLGDLLLGFFLADADVWAMNGHIGSHPFARDPFRFGCQHSHGDRPGEVPLFLVAYYPVRFSAQALPGQVASFDCKVSADTRPPESFCLLHQFRSPMKHP